MQRELRSDSTFTINYFLCLGKSLSPLGLSLPICKMRGMDYIMVKFLLLLIPYDRGCFKHSKNHGGFGSHLPGRLLNGSKIDFFKNGKAKWEQAYNL